MFCYYCMQPMPENTSVCPHCGQQGYEAKALHHLKPGTKLNGKYLVGRVLGEGGFGITYIGRNLDLDIRVAIKEYYPKNYANRNNLASSDVTMTANNEDDVYKKGRDRFLHEARTLARFSREPHVVNVIDFFEENNTAYFVMDYLSGSDLKTYLKKNGTLNAEDAVTWFIPIMRALSKVHDKGMIHRDISPDNIIVEDGNLILIDFGASREMDTDKSLSVILKHGYAPFEQHSSRGKQGPWTDIYALCATLYKCITGEVPPEASGRVFEDDIVSPSQMGIDIPPKIEAALMKGLSNRYMDRQQNMEQLIYELTGGEDATNAHNTITQTSEGTHSVFVSYGNTVTGDDNAEKTVSDQSKGNFSRTASLDIPYNNSDNNSETGQGDTVTVYDVPPAENADYALQEESAPDAYPVYGYAAYGDIGQTNAETSFSEELPDADYSESAENVTYVESDEERSYDYSSYEQETYDGDAEQPEEESSYSDELPDAGYSESAENTAYDEQGSSVYTIVPQVNESEIEPTAISEADIEPQPAKNRKKFFKASVCAAAILFILKSSGLLFVSTRTMVILFIVISFVFFRVGKKNDSGAKATSKNRKKIYIASACAAAVLFILISSALLRAGQKEVPVAEVTSSAVTESKVTSSAAVSSMLVSSQASSSKAVSSASSSSSKASSSKASSSKAASSKATSSKTSSKKSESSKTASKAAATQSQTNNVVIYTPAAVDNGGGEEQPQNNEEQQTPKNEQKTTPNTDKPKTQETSSVQIEEPVASSEPEVISQPEEPPVDNEYAYREGDTVCLDILVRCLSKEEQNKGTIIGALNYEVAYGGDYLEYVTNNTHGNGEATIMINAVNPGEAKIAVMTMEGLENGEFEKVELDDISFYKICTLEFKVKADCDGFLCEGNCVSLSKMDGDGAIQNVPNASYYGGFSRANDRRGTVTYGYDDIVIVG